MKLLGRRNNGADRNDDEADGAAENESTAGPIDTVGTTAPKGRPTPKRSEKDKRRGPVAPAPMTTAEARQRRKAARKTMTKEERQADRARQRSIISERNERMKAGEEAYLIGRDKGPVRRLARD
ncbi:DUF3043 domain-containing protein, partial [Mycolicibacterium sp.]|uniref:DUF3043 domain-containing protein n=1 Tax=Mycolicibacterium sp. TaxID=2320850 RepID=UPI0028AD2D25